MKHYDSLIIGRITKDFNIDHLKNEIQYSFTKSSSVLAQRLPILVNILPPVNDVQIATNSKFTKGVKSYTVSKNKTVSKKITKLKGKKKYYVRVRTYKTVKVNGKSVRIYSGWSKVKTVTTKK